MVSGELVLTQDGPIATIVITNPAKRNAMTAAMWRALPGLLDGPAKDPSVRVLILAGAGGTFCAGADITEAAAVARAGDASFAVAAERALAGFPKPTIARIDGFCVGGGCQLAVACDLRFAADDSRFGVTPAKLGIVYPPSTTRRLATLIGPARAKLLLYTADLIDAAAAERMGLVDAVVPAADLADSVLRVATTIAARSGLTQFAAKRVLADGDPPDQDEAELAEGLTAFTERRPPHFGWS
ncbi:enoyl-CoA hydratase/isomerase family protein [Dactylosporangium sp. NPDC048998]|uniref:enoyl-CoA hydratase/isomerase family protein n=1 Tax=Dactylosporangium sp. NPDC048998 TaxID=3363976 RepID=UPI003713F844